MTEPDQPPEVSSRPTKIDGVLILLGRDTGASLVEITNATGWQAHTARAVLTGLRKKGRTIERSRIDGASRYRIIPGGDQ